MMLGFLLARAGVRVVVLEKHADFLRDFRGDTIHPSTLEVIDDLGAPIDVFWMRLSRRPSDGAELFGRIGAGKIFVMIDRGDYWQCAFVIPKGSAEAVRARGIEAFRAAIVEIAPMLRDRVQEL